MPYRNGDRRESNTLSTGEKRVAELRNLFGDTALLLAWPNKSKGSAKKWGHFTAKEMAEPSYLLALNKAGNIGLALGEKSVGLCAIDLDRDNLRDEFLTENPWAANTTEICGARGCKYIVRVQGAYPRTAHFRCRGEDVAQWLADGSQAIVSGIHPTGIEYRCTQQVSPYTIEYGQIRWPGSLSIPSKHRQFTEQRSNRATEAPEQKSNEAFKAVVSEVVIKFVPSAPHQNNDLMFQIGRGLKGIEKKRAQPFTIVEYRVAFRIWAEYARPYWRGECSEDDYWFEFLDICKRAEFGLGENPLSAAWEAAQAIPSVPEAGLVDDPRLKLLINVCAALARDSSEFFVPTRWLAEKFRVSHTHAALWVRGLRHLGILKPVRAGTTTRCPRYTFCPLLLHPQLGSNEV